MSRTSNSIFGPMAMVVLTFSLGAIAAYREPEGLIAFMIAALFLPVAWTVIEIKKRNQERDERFYENQAAIRWSISAAGLLMAVPLAFTLVVSFGITEALGDAMEQRILGVLFGVIFLLYGNAAPKRPIALQDAGCSPERAQAQARFAGRMFVLTALAYTLIWAFAPIEWAMPAAMAVLFSGVIVVVASAASLYRSKN
ncbi:hypothetical protein [Maricaulis sp.]|uniref:hypothetical protein n=1 Tax=unclassified Maricaulis TaxID=2632371 RepID=UPI001B176658|nr:hypothetical protein [Maricaulis sp.]MBO6797840.1 hypothetical protein [Maricaulis sp.]